MLEISIAQFVIWFRPVRLQFDSFLVGRDSVIVSREIEVGIPQVEISFMIFWLQGHGLPV